MDKYFFLAVVLAVAVFATLGTGFVSISLEGLDAADLGTKFLGVIMAALFIERAVEVIVSMKFGVRETAITQPVLVARAAVTRHQQNLSVEARRTVPDGPGLVAVQAAANDAQARLNDSKDAEKTTTETAAQELEALSGEKKTYATVANVLLSLAAALVGFRVFGQFLPADGIKVAEAGVDAARAAEIAASQTRAFNVFDVVVTTLVLSGGSEGLHNTLGQFLSKRNEVLNPPSS